MMVWLIDHARGRSAGSDSGHPGYVRLVEIVPGTELYWVGSSYPMHHSGEPLHGAHVLHVLSGDLRGGCVEVRTEERGREGELPRTLAPAEVRW